MTNESVLAEVVRMWIDQELPGDRGASERAVAIAEAAYRQGASVREACGQARDFVGSWVRHPAHPGAYRGAAVRLAS